MRPKDSDELTVTMTYEMYWKIVGVLRKECLNMEYYFEVEELVHMIDRLESEVSRFENRQKELEGKEE